jgi:hypothetical protein
MPREIVCPACKLVIPVDCEPSGPSSVGAVGPGTSVGDSFESDDPDRRAWLEAVAGHAEPAPELESEERPALDSPPVEPWLSGAIPSGFAGRPGRAGPLLSSSDEALSVLRAAPDPFLAGLDQPGPGSEPAAASPGGRVASEVDTPAHGDASHRGPGIGMVVLGSYASAVTLALAWLLLTGGGRGASPGPATLVGKARPDQEGDGTSFVRGLREIPPGRRTSVGRPLRVGSLELTPLGVDLGPVELENLDGERKTVEGAPTLRLRLALRNLSETEAFEPLEPAFLRTPDRGAPESLVVAGDRPIAPYPLAIASEWSLVGQPLGPLGPGEEREVVVASEPGAVDRLATEMTWRLRVRVAPGRTEVVGVEFGRADVGVAESP